MIKLFKVILFCIAVIFFLSNRSAAQVKAEAGIFNPSGTTIEVRAKLSPAITDSALFSNVVVTMRWAHSLGVTLGSVTSSYSFVKDRSWTSNGYDYQTFACTPNVYLKAADDTISLFTLNASTPGGTGTFELAQNSDTSVTNRNAQWYFELASPSNTDESPEFYQQSVDIALPVVISSFSAANKDRVVQLDWTTATEINSSSFEIQQEKDSAWSDVGSVKASGMSNSPKQYSFEQRVENVTNGNFSYRLKMIEKNGQFQYSNAIAVKLVPSVYALEQNYPNPFNPTTKIEYELPENAKVTLKVYDITGREVTTLVNNEQQQAGFYEVNFGNYHFASGVYIYRMMASANGKTSFVKVKKMLLIK
jgi:Secretion system C-terminal sorting domain